MSYTLRDITTENAQAAFVSDVSLAWYTTNHPNSARLAGAYSWTRQQIGEELPSLAALNLLRESFESDEIVKYSGNRHLWEAIFGHGKSHLALTLANFFGKPSGSPEVDSILDAIAHAKGDAASLRHFKADRKPYLVLCLFGNGDDTLAQGIARGLEKAFANNPATKGTDLGLWYEPALVGLEALAAKSDEATKATAFLQTLTPALTLQDLRDDLTSRRGQYREQLTQMVHHVTGWSPTFGDMLGPKQMIEQVAEKFCGPEADKPFAGLLVLFDEFGRFVQDYAYQYNLLSKNQPLQNLLEGIAGLQSRAAIVAFTQANPEGIAGRAMGANAIRLDEVNKELTRFPDPQRKVLVSPLEAVLGDFLKQDEDKWNALLDANPVAESDLDAAIDMTKLLFSARYASWSAKQVQDQLGRECYPLHPLTTALLCTLGIRETVSARPSLGFVQEAYRRFAEYAALTPAGTLQFIPATQLVAVFKESLAKKDEDWNRYLNALRLADAEIPQLRKPEAATLKADVLASMFVRETAGLSIGTGITEFENIIAALCGHPRAAVAQALRELAADGRIQHDPAGKKYLFWSLSQDGMKATRLLTDEANRLVADPISFASALRGQLANLAYAEEVSLGNAIDWAAPVHVIPRALWSREYLRQLLRRYQLNDERTWLDTSARHGYAVRPVGYTDEEVAWLRTHAPVDFEAVMQELDAAYPPPTVLVLPQVPHTGLLQALARKHALAGWGSQTRADLGDKAIEQIQNQVNEQCRVEIGRLRDEEKKIAEYRVASVYTPAVNAAFSTIPTPSLQAILKVCYAPAYGWRAPYLNDAISSTSYRKGVWTACNHLRRDKFIDWEDNTQGSGGAPARKVFDYVLRDTPTTWGVVDDGLRVVDPRLPVVQHGWKVLEEAVPAGTSADDRVSLRAPLLKLLNAPYGYDYYALGLLFCAWAGRHRRTLHFYRGNSFQPLASADWFTAETNFEKVIANLLGPLDLHASREDQGAITQRIELLLHEWQEHQLLSFSEAQSRLAELREFAQNETNDAALREQAHETAIQLAAAIQAIEEYHSRLTQFAEELPALVTVHPDVVRAALKLLAEARKDAPQVGVQPSNLTQATDLEAQVLAKIQTLIGQLTNIHTSPQQTSTTTKCKEGENRLSIVQSYLAGVAGDVGLPKVQEALISLKAIAERITEEEQDAALLARLKEIEKIRNLAELRDALSELSTRTAHSVKGNTALQTTQEAVAVRIEQFEQLLSAAHLKANELPDRAGKSPKVLAREIAALTTSLQRLHDQVMNAAVETAQLEQAVKWCAVWSKIFDDIIDLSEETPENTRELQNLLKKYDKLTQLENSTEAQQAFVLEARQAAEAKVADQVQAAVDTLTDLIAQSDQKDPVVPTSQLLHDLQTAREITFHFLPKEDKLRRERLEKTLQKRLDADQVEDIVYRFDKIQDDVQRAKCIERLQALLKQPVLL